MCGHFGYISNDPKIDFMKRKKYFNQMTIFDTLRGADSTGIYLKEGSTTWLYKRALDGYDFSRLNIVAKQILKLDCSVAMGHNRAATKGTVNDDNAHPFKCGNTILTHNGTLTNFYSLPDRDGTEVDSHWICKEVDAKGIDYVAKTVAGAFALAFYNEETNMFSLITNGERELAFGISENSKTMYYASEGDMLATVCYRNDIDLLKNEWVTCKKGVLYEFPVDNPAGYTTRELELHKYIAPTTHSTTIKRDKFMEPYVFKGGNNEKKETFVAVLQQIGLNFGTFLRLGFLDSEPKRQSIDFLALEPEDVYSKCSDLIVRYVARSEDEFYRLLNNADKIFTANVQAGVRPKGRDETILYLRNIQITKEDIPADLYETPDFGAMVKGPSGMYIPVKEFKILAKDGCWQCQGDVSPEDAEFISWTSPNATESKIAQPICQSCVNDWNNYVRQH